MEPPRLLRRFAFHRLVPALLLWLLAYPTHGATWDERIAPEYPVWGRLCARTLPNFATSQPLSRLEGADYVLKNFPASPYAADAALLAASLSWDIRSSATLQMLRDVIAQHPQGKHFISDPTWQRYAPMLIARGPDGRLSTALLRADAWTTPSLVRAYFDHLEANPNWTADEARLTLADCYLRMNDTTQSLEQINAILAKYPDGSRTARDMQAAQQPDGRLRVGILRTEEKARLLLVAMHYRYTGNLDAALAAANDYAALYPDREYGKYVQMIRGLIYQSRGDLVKAREAFATALSIIERYSQDQTLNNLPIENCVRATYFEIKSGLVMIERQLAPARR